MFEQRIQKGIDLLNRRCPGWIEKINLDNLDMMCTENCILGQLFLNYDRGLKKLILLSGEKYGFNPSDHFIDMISAVEAYNTLTTEWKNEVSSMLTVIINETRE